MNLNPKQVEERLNSPKNIADFLAPKSDQVVTIQKEKRGPKEGAPRLPTFAQETIAIMSRGALDSNENIARAFGTSPQNVSSIKRGLSHREIDESKVDSAVEKVTGEIKDRALGRLMASLNLLDDDKLAGCKAIDLSQIAANMGKVYERISPKTAADANVNLIIYSPQIRQERHYKTIEVESTIER